VASGVIAGTPPAFPILSEVLDAAARIRVLRVAYPKTHTPSEAERTIFTGLPCPSMGLGDWAGSGCAATCSAEVFRVLRQLQL